MPNLQRRKFLFLSIILFFAFTGIISCSPSNRQSYTDNSETSVQAGDFAPGQLGAHYLKHRYEFSPGLTEEQYLADARALLNAPPGKDILQKIRANGDILRYKRSTGEFAIMDSTGRIRTYFKTDYNYWLRQ